MTQLTMLYDAIESVATHLPALADVAVRSSLILLLALVVTTLMRRTSAAARHSVWVCAVLVALMIPLLGRITPRWEPRILPARWGTASAPAIDATSLSTQASPTISLEAGRTATASTIPVAAPPAISRTGPPPVPTAVPTSATPTAHARTWSIAELIAVVWIVGAALVLLRLALGTGVVWSTARHARRVDDAEWLLLVQRKARELGIARPVILLASPRQTVPVTWGVIYPIVLLPERALEWESERREAVLVHELAHVGRLDALTHTIVQLAVAVFWFNPFVWIAARHVRSERERACDDLVLVHGTRASAYAEDLLSMVRSLTRNSEPAFAALAMARRSEFEGRMLAILDPRASRRRIGVRGVAIAFACSLAIAFPLAALRPLPQVAHVAKAPVSTTHTEAATAATDQQGGKVSVASASGRPSSLNCTLGKGRHVSINSDGGESNFMISDDSHCIAMVSTGKIAFTDDDAAIKSISPGGHVEITEVTSSSRRKYVASPELGGLAETFYLSGSKVPATDENRAWLRGVVLQIVRQDADLAPERARRIRARSGVAGVLSEVSAISGDYGKAAYLKALVSEGGLTSDALHLITNVGVQQLTSDYYKSQFLEQIAKLTQDASTAATLASAAGSMKSDYYKRQVLSSAIAGNGDRAVIAREVIATTTGFTSDYDRAQVLDDLLARGTLGDSLTVSLIQSAGGINSDYYRETVLDSVIATQSVKARTVYTALLQAAKGISSDYYRSQVLMRMLQQRDITPEAAAATLSSASDINSANDKANVLVAAAETPAIRNATVRDAYFATAKTLGGGAEARRAMSAVLP